MERNRSPYNLIQMHWNVFRLGQPHCLQVEGRNTSTGNHLLVPLPNTTVQLIVQATRTGPAFKDTTDNWLVETMHPPCIWRCVKALAEYKVSRCTMRHYVNMSCWPPTLGGTIVQRVLEGVLAVRPWDTRLGEQIPSYAVMFTVSLFACPISQ